MQSVPEVNTPEDTESGHGLEQVEDVKPCKTCF